MPCPPGRRTESRSRSRDDPASRLDGRDRVAPARHRLVIPPVRRVVGAAKRVIASAAGGLALCLDGPFELRLGLDQVRDLFGDGLLGDGLGLCDRDDVLGDRLFL